MSQTQKKIQKTRYFNFSIVKICVNIGLWRIEFPEGHCNPLSPMLVYWGKWPPGSYGYFFSFLHSKGGKEKTFSTIAHIADFYLLHLLAPTTKSE